MPYFAGTKISLKFFCTAKASTHIFIDKAGIPENA